jgi:high-affinity Fe2+/Pb2+ permease
MSGVVFALAVIAGVWVADPRSADWQTAHIVAGAVAGAVVAVALGAALLWTSRAPQPMAPRHVPA